VKHRFFYSEQQTMGECSPKVKTPEGWKEYSEWCSSDNIPNWKDAKLIYETDEQPEIDLNMCGYCYRCSTFMEQDYEVIEEEVCEYSKNGKCMHPWSEGELSCDGMDKDKSNCTEHIEVGN
jgi:hypothetical protein